MHSKRCIESLQIDCIRALKVLKQQFRKFNVLCPVIETHKSAPGRRILNKPAALALCLLSLNKALVAIESGDSTEEATRHCHAKQ